MQLTFALLLFLAMFVIAKYGTWATLKAWLSWVLGSVAILIALSRARDQHRLSEEIALAIAVFVVCNWLRYYLNNRSLYRHFRHTSLWNTLFGTIPITAAIVCAMALNTVSGWPQRVFPFVVFLVLSTYLKGRWYQNSGPWKLHMILATGVVVLADFTGLAHRTTLLLRSSVTWLTRVAPGFPLHVLLPAMLAAATFGVCAWLFYPVRRLMNLAGDDLESDRIERVPAFYLATLAFLVLEGVVGLLWLISRNYGWLGIMMIGGLLISSFGVFCWNRAILGLGVTTGRRKHNVMRFGSQLSDLPAILVIMLGIWLSVYCGAQLIHSTLWKIALVVGAIPVPIFLLFPKRAYTGAYIVQTEPVDLLGNTVLAELGSFFGVWIARRYAGVPTDLAWLSASVGAVGALVVVRDVFAQRTYLE